MLFIEFGIYIILDILYIIIYKSLLKQGNLDFWGQMY